MRRRLQPMGIGLAVTAAAAYGAWAWAASRHRLSTEDAYVEVAVMAVSARVLAPLSAATCGTSSVSRPASS